MNYKHYLAATLERASHSPRFRRTLRSCAKLHPPPAGLLERLEVDDHFDVSFPGGRFAYAGDRDDAVARHLYWTGLTRWEAESWSEFVALAQSSRGFADIGAFTGTYSLVAASANPNLRSVAFEPVPRVFERLQRNIELNSYSDRIFAVNAAVSDTIGSTQFFIPDRPLPDTSFLSSSNRVSTEAGRWHDVPTTTLTAALPPDLFIDLIKIDVEDAEGPVVLSLSPLIAKNRPTILIEFLSTGTYGQAWDILAAMDYDLFHLTRNGRIKVSRPTPDDENFNFLCVPREL